MPKKVLARSAFISLALALGLVALGWVFSGGVARASPAFSRLYTLDADFDEGALFNVEHDTAHNQLQLSKEHRTLPFIWVPNNNGTVSKVDTDTGNELGRYRVAPHSDCSPSRTTVDLQGSCYVGNRQAGTVVKIGLLEADQWIDRNGNGVPDTSQDLDANGDISGAEILPWGQDECVLYEIVLIPGHEGTYTPGTYPGPYDKNYWGVGPRGLAVDKYNNLWAGTWSTSRYFYIDGATCAILKQVNVSTGSYPYGHNAYGAAIDKNGILWSSGPSHTGSQTDHILRLDPSTDPPTLSRIPTGHRVYGVGLDYLNHLFVSGWDSSKFSRLNIVTAGIEWTKGTYYNTRGVACTSDNDVWIVSSHYWAVYRYDNNGTLKTGIGVGPEPTGVAIDAKGKVWVCDNGDEYIRRINPATNAVDLTKRIIGSGGHYTYSDMTGMVVRTITTRIGTWTVIADSGATDTPWGTVSWNGEPQGSEPPGTSIIVKVRSSNDKVTWSGWETAGNGVPLSATPNGRYLQVQTTLQILSGDVSPVLSDLTVKSAEKNTPGKVTGAGWYVQGGFRRNLMVDVEFVSGSFTKTLVRYLNHSNRLFMQSTKITSFVISNISNKIVKIEGDCTVNSVPGYNFKLEIKDTNPDYFALTIKNGGGATVDSTAGKVAGGDFIVILY